MLIIGLGHRARQGKNTLADYIKEMYGNKYYIRLYSFAEELKREVNEIYEKHGNWDDAFTYINKQVEGGLPHWVTIQAGELLDMTDPLCPYGKQRTLLQFWGTYRREISPNYWVKKVASKLKQDEEEIQVAVITDVRFPNEFNWIKSFDRSGITVKVERTGYEVNENNEHISEKALDGYDFDYVITAGSLEELRDDAQQFFELLITRETMPEEFKEWEV